MSRAKTVEQTSLGAAVLGYVECDECGQRWADSSDVDTHYWVERSGIVGRADETEWDFCSAECVGVHFFRGAMEAA